MSPFICVDKSVPPEGYLTPTRLWGGENKKAGADGKSAEMVQSGATKGDRPCCQACHAAARVLILRTAKRMAASTGFKSLWWVAGPTLFVNHTFRACGSVSISDSVSVWRWHSHWLAAVPFLQPDAVPPTCSTWCFFSSCVSTPKDHRYNIHGINTVGGVPGVGVLDGHVLWPRSE